ncbi:MULTISPECIES: polysaccharide ABC transporter ATP-binding protein [unclassified Clostridium]|uniref:ABC transporter ATP-binding protein n=1 Tax=unclassified Clostridium TaxID=2614128 RepID=UPI003217F9DD
MVQEVLRVEGIGKKYRLLSNQDKSDTFIAVLLNSIKGAFSKKNKMSSGNEFWALKDINFTVNRGERIGIIGHNGAGKSTILKVFSRITLPTEGEIKIKGRISSLLEIGTGFNQELTGRENIYLNGSILGMKKKEIEAKFKDIVEFSEIGEFLDTPVKRYSSGMHVKLAFAVAAHLDPDILIVDEVLAVGDMRFQEKCLGKMEDIADGGRTILYVSHSMRTIQQLCSRVIVLDHGKIIFDGDVDDGIKVYMNNNFNTTPLMNLENQKRQSHIMQSATIISTQILNNKDCIFTSKESITFKMKWKAGKDLFNLRLRVEVLFSDNTPVGVSYSKPFVNAKSGIMYDDIFNLDISTLAPGKYSAILLLTQMNQYGSYTDVDRVERALNFEIIPEESEIEKVAWTHRWWGHVSLPEVKKVSNTNEKITKII